MKQQKTGLRAILAAVSLAVSFALTAALQRLLFLSAAKSDKLQKPQHYYEWKEGSVAYEIIGSGRPLLLLHNTQIGASHREWDKNISTLSKEFQVFLVDLPGFAASSKPKITYTAYQYALFINDFIEEVIGQSSSVAASSASADFTVMACYMKPSNFRRLLLISPTGVNSDLPQNNDSCRQRLLQSPLLGTQLFLKHSSKRAIAQMLRHETFFAQEKVTAEIIDTYYCSAHYGGETARFSYASAASHYLNTEITAAFQALRIPIFLVWGDGNRSNTTANLEALKKLRPTVQYALFEQCRLLPHYENSTAFNEAALRFFK